MGRFSRTLAIVMATALLSTSCAHRAEMSREQRRECRRLRTKAALAGVGVTVGMAVVATALVVIVVASRGNISSSGGSGGRRRRQRRRERRRLRHQVCYETLESTAQVDETAEAEPLVEPPPPMPAPSQAAAPEPPSDEVLAASFERIEPKIRECLGVESVVEFDVAIDGRSGRVTGYAVHGMSVNAQQGQCLVRQLQRLRFQPFDDELRVRFAIDLGWVPPPPSASPPQVAP